MQSAVYATEVSMEEYLTYTTEETEKVEVMNRAAQLGGDIETAIRQLAIEKRNNKKKYKTSSIFFIYISKCK